MGGSLPEQVQQPARQLVHISWRQLQGLQGAAEGGLCVAGQRRQVWVQLQQADRTGEVLERLTGTPGAQRIHKVHNT